MVTLVDLFCGNVSDSELVNSAIEALKKRNTAPLTVENVKKLAFSLKCLCITSYGGFYQKSEFGVMNDDAIQQKIDKIR